MLSPHDLALKHLLLPGLVSVEVQPAGTETLIAVSGARQRGVRISEADSEESAVPGPTVHCVWILPAAGLDEHVPSVGDQILFQDSIWIIDAASAAMLQSVWQCACHQLPL